MDIEDGFAYMEPPRVYQPIRQCLGYVLLEADEVEEAERVGRFSHLCSSYVLCDLHFLYSKSSFLDSIRPSSY